MMVLVETTKGLSSPSSKIFEGGAAQPLIHNPNKIPNTDQIFCFKS